jgi:hypothetical protein
MTPPLSAAELRRWALCCASQAENLGTSDESRTRLLKMREAILSLANNQDWLDGAPTHRAANSETAEDVQDAADQILGIRAYSRQTS